MFLWDNLSVSRLSHSWLLEVVGLKLKPNNQNILEFYFIIIIEILVRVVNKFSEIWKNNNNLIYAENVCVLRYSI